MNSDKTNKEQLEKYNSIHKIDKTEKNKIIKLIKILIGLSITFFTLLIMSGKFEIWMIELFVVVTIVLFEIMILPKNQQISIMKHNTSRFFDVLAYTAIGIIFVLAILAILSYFLKKI